MFCPFTPSLPQAPGYHWAFHCLHSFIFSRTSWSWDYLACNLFRLIDFFHVLTNIYVSSITFHDLIAFMTWVYGSLEPKFIRLLLPCCCFSLWVSMSPPNAEHWAFFWHCPLLTSPRGTTQEVQAPETFSESLKITPMSYRNS